MTLHDVDHADENDGSDAVVNRLEPLGILYYKYNKEPPPQKKKKIYIYSIDDDDDNDADDWWQRSSSGQARGLPLVVRQAGEQRPRRSGSVTPQPAHPKTLKP